MGGGRRRRDIVGHRRVGGDPGGAYATTPVDQFRLIVVIRGLERRYGGTDQWCREGAVARGGSSGSILREVSVELPMVMIEVASGEPHPSLFDSNFGHPRPVGGHSTL